MKDVGFKRGDLITSYYKGIWSVISITDRGRDMGPLVFSRLVANSQYELVRHTNCRECSSGWCKKISKKMLLDIQGEPYKTRALKIVEYYFDSGLYEILK